MLLNMVVGISPETII